MMHHAADLTRRRLQHHALTLETHAAYLRGADEGRVGCCIDVRGQGLAVEIVVAGIASVLARGAGRQTWTAVADRDQDTLVHGEHDPSDRLRPIGRRQRLALWID